MIKPRTYPLRVRLVGGRVVHAAWTHRMYIEGAGMTACTEQYTPDDQQLPADTLVDCAHCRRASTNRETT